MKLIVVFGVLLIASSVQAGDKDIIKDKSPDGKFALRMTKREEVWWAAIIDLKGKDDVVELEVYQNQGDVFIKQEHLVWSKDSQKVAYFEPDRRGGSTAVYFRDGSEFKEIQLPQIPDCDAAAKQEGDEYVKTLDYRVSPVRWLKSGALLLAVSNQWLMKSGSSPECSETVTIAFDAQRKASVESVKDKK